MLKDITIGQHFPGNSLLHRLDPRMKILLTIGYVIVLFIGSNVLGLLISTVFVFSLYYVAKISVRVILKSLKPIIPIVIFTSVINLFFIRTGTAIFEWQFIKITDDGVSFAVMMVVRIICLISGTSLLTYTTSPIVLTDAIERLLSPFAKIKLPVHELAMMMTIALRFIPTLIEETDKIMNAQKARGAMLDSGSIKNRIKALVPVLIPLFISAFRRADELAMAMECRCYHGGEGRTRMKQLKLDAKDYIVTVVGVLIFLLISFSATLSRAGLFFITAIFA